MKTTQGKKLSKKLWRKFFVIGVVVTLLLSNYSVASASVDKPTDTWNLMRKGYYYGSGKANNTKPYSNYWFTGASKMKISVTNKGGDDITVNVYRQDGSVSYKRVKVTTGGSATWTMNVTSGKKYNLCFSAPCNFNYIVMWV